MRSVIILVINESDSHCMVVRFCRYSYDYRLNWTPLSPITITYHSVRHEMSKDEMQNIQLVSAII